MASAAEREILTVDGHEVAVSNPSKGASLSSSSSVFSLLSLGDDGREATGLLA